METDQNKKLGMKFCLWIVAVILVLGVLLTIAILSSPSDGKPGIVAPEKPTPERKDLIERTFSKEEAGNPHRRFGFEVLNCQKRLYDFVPPSVWLYVVGEVKNISPKPLDVELQAIVKDSDGREVASDRFYVGCNTNIVPGETAVFEYDHFNFNQLRHDVENFTVDVKIIRSETRY